MTMGILTDINGVVPQRAIRYLDTMPYYVSYADELVDFGGAGETTVFGTPTTFRGKPIAVDLYNNSETIAATTQPRVDIGDGADADIFATTGDIADGAAGQTFNVADGTLTAGLQEIVEPGDQVTITYVAGITTPTGICTVSTTMLYFK